MRSKLTIWLLKLARLTTRYGFTSDYIEMAIDMETTLEDFR